MNDSRIVLKHPSGFFAAGAEMKDALGLLSDGTFKLYAYVCLHADRRTAQLRFRMAELAQAIGHSTRSLTAYLDELSASQVGIVYRAANQHEVGRIEIHDRFWPYRKEAPDSAANPEQSLYISRLRGLFLEPACVTASFSAADENLAAEWYRAGFSLELVERALLLGCARKYISLFNRTSNTPVTCLLYFAGCLDEVRHTEVGMDYWRYLADRFKKMDAQWRAQANLAPADGENAAETK